MVYGGRKLWQFKIVWLKNLSVRRNRLRYKKEKKTLMATGIVLSRRFLRQRCTHVHSGQIQNTPLFALGLKHYNFKIMFKFSLGTSRTCVNVSLHYSIKNDLIIGSQCWLYRGNM